MIYKIVTLFVDVLAADGKHYLVNRDNLSQPHKTQLSQKQKGFDQLFVAFLKFILSFEHFPKKDNRHN